MAKLLLQIDPSIEEHDITKLYEEALSQEQDVGKGLVSPESFCIVVLRHRVGGYGVGIFDIHAIEPLLPRATPSEVRIPSKSVQPSVMHSQTGSQSVEEFVSQVIEVPGPVEEEVVELEGPTFSVSLSGSEPPSH
jgi:hypothetical protein